MVTRGTRQKIRMAYIHQRFPDWIMIRGSRTLQIARIPSTTQRTIERKILYFTWVVRIAP